MPGAPKIPDSNREYCFIVRYVFVGAVAAGAYTADIGVEVQDNKAYASGFSVI